MKNEFVKKYQDKIQGVLGCYDRIVIKGTLPNASHPGAMTNLLYRKNYMLNDITQFTGPLRNEVYANAKRIAKSSGIEIEYIRNNKKVRKEDIVKKKIAEGGIKSGLVCILSATESCPNYVSTTDKTTGRTYLKRTGGKCTHFYFYFLDPTYGLCYLRVPTWCPFQLQFYFNAHNWLAIQLDKAQIKYELKDNAFTYIEDFAKAQSIADSLDAKQLQTKLDQLADLYCPVYKEITSTGYH